MKLYEATVFIVKNEKHSLVFLCTCDFLTPKGLNVRTADKPVLVSVTWAHTIFRFFETFCEYAPCNKLRGKTEIVFFGPTDQKLWVFEVSRRSLGRAGMCCSQPARVDHLRKKWRVGRNFFSSKMETAPQVQASTRGRRATAGWRLDLWGYSHFFEIFLFKFFYFFWKFGRWARASGRMGVQHLHFLMLAPTLGSANSFKIHGEWRFHFFPKKIILYLEHTWTFIFTVGIFVSSKKWIH
jgi:hypothetical protein